MAISVDVSALAGWLGAWGWGRVDGDWAQGSGWLVRWGCVNWLTGCVLGWLAGRGWTWAEDWIGAGWGWLGAGWGWLEQAENRSGLLGLAGAGCCWLGLAGTRCCWLVLAAAVLCWPLLAAVGLQMAAGWLLLTGNFC